MAVVPRALGLVAAFAVLGTAMYLVYRYNKKKGVVNVIEMDAMDQSSSPSSSKIAGKFARPLNSGSQVHQVVQLNESLFELYKPSGKPSLQILFFHGFQFGDNYDNAHISTWESGESGDQDGTFLWPQTWLREKFPDAHILSIAYNCHMKENREYGSADLFILGENLMADLLAENIGQERRCPVVLVGHSFGGLVMKKLCLHARDKGSTGSTEHSKFLENVKGLFFYSTPHGGIHSEKVPPLFESKSRLLEYVQSLSTSTSRLNDDFERLHRFYSDWRIAGVGEGCVTKWDPYLPFMVVEEASSRYGDDFLVVPGANHITISRPAKKISTTFTFLTKLIGRVSETRKVSGVIHQTQGLPNFSSGLEERVEDVQKKLTMDASQATVLGIVGMGGIGKTTIAKQLFNGISSKYEYTCFVDNVKGIHDLEDRLLRNFHRDGQRLKKDEIGWSSIQNKKTLIVMDDVDSEDQLKNLPKLDYFGGDSHLIITSRDHNVCSAYHNCVLYDVEFLTFDEAKKLLCQHVFDMDTTEGDHRMVECVDELVKKCQGLPLTLEVMGSYLRQHKHKVAFWNQVIRKLGETQPINGSQNDRVWASLKVSFDDLQQEEQQMFIEAGTCFFEETLDEALAAWSSSYGCVEMVWENLIRRSLVKAVTKRRSPQQHIWVHEQLRDLAKNISQRHMIIVSRELYGDTFIPYHGAILMKKPVGNANWYDEVVDDDEYLKLCLEGKDDSNNDDKDDRVSFWLDARVTNVEELGSIEPLLSSNWQQTLQLESLERLENLKYLYLRDVMPQGFIRNFPRTVSLLKWTMLHSKYPPNLPEIDWKGMNNLGLLHLENWEIPDEFIEALGKLTNLRNLYLRRLDLDYLPKDIGNLSFLKQLHLSELTMLALPKSFGGLLALEQLLIDDLEISRLPESIGGLCSLETFRINNCQRLRTLPESFGCLGSLQTLDIIQCKNLGTLPESFGALCSLETLYIGLCENLGTLPECFGGLHALKKLDIDCCRNLRSLPESFGGLCSLKILKIRECDQLRSLPESFGDLCSLETLDITYCENLGTLAESFGGLYALKKLNIESCVNLRSLPESFGGLRSLKTLNIRECDQLRSLPESIRGLCSLEELDIWRCGSLGSLPESIAGLRSLKILLIQECKQLRSLPASFGCLCSLEKLCIERCGSLGSLPESIAGLRSLKILLIQACEQLRSLPESFGGLRCLKILHIKFCKQLGSLPESIGGLCSLEELDIIGYECLGSLPDSFGHLSSLKNLRLEKLGVESFPASFGLLSNLKVLELTEFHKLKRLPVNFAKLKALRQLHLTHCPTLQSLPDNFGGLKALRLLVLEDCPKLESFPDTFGQLKALKRLGLKDCPTLQRLPLNFPELKRLRIIRY